MKTFTARFRRWTVNIILVERSQDGETNSILAEFLVARTSKKLHGAPSRSFSAPSHSRAPPCMEELRKIYREPIAISKYCLRSLGTPFASTVAGQSWRDCFRQPYPSIARRRAKRSVGAAVTRVFYTLSFPPEKRGREDHLDLVYSGIASPDDLPVLQAKPIPATATRDPTPPTVTVAAPAATTAKLEAPDDTPDPADFYLGKPVYAASNHSIPTSALAITTAIL